MPVLGIGFGAQALGVALGGAVRRVRTGGPAWINVESRDPARLPSGPWLLPRNDAISAPPDAEELACDEWVRSRSPSGATSACISIRR